MPKVKKDDSKAFKTGSDYLGLSVKDTMALYEANLRLLKGR